VEHAVMTPAVQPVLIQHPLEFLGILVDAQTYIMMMEAPLNVRIVFLIVLLAKMESNVFF
jgi:hypothetical protein